MNWNNLHILAVLSREGSLAGAARVLGVNHATVSRRLLALEDQVGHGLIRRLSRSTPLTVKGHEIAELALEMEERVQKIERIVNLAKDTITGTVRLSAPPAFLSETLMPELTVLSQSHPDIQLVFMADAQITSLDRGEADIAVRLVEPKASQNIIRKLGTISYALYGTHDQIKRAPDKWQFVGFDSSLAHTPQQIWLDDFAAGRPFHVVSNDFYSQRAAAEAGLGFALLPDKIASQSKHLARASDQIPPVRTAWLVMHQDVKHAPAVRIVADLIVKAFKRND